MKTKDVVIFITLLLIVNCVKAQGQQISQLKTHTITLSRHASRDKTAPSRFWILVNNEGRQVKPVEFELPTSRIDSNPSADVVDAGATNIGRTQAVDLPRHRYSLSYVGFSKTADDLWLQIMASPVSGMGLVKDIGQMKWEEVDLMPTLVLKPITNGMTMSINHGAKTIGPEGLIVRALAGHVYAMQIKDDRIDYRVIFRIDEIDSKGDCRISWKRIPSN